MAQFDELLKQLDRMQKALPGDDGQDDEKIQAMADGDADGDGTPDGEEDLPMDDEGEPDGDEDGEDDDGDGDGFGKSFAVQLSDGSKVQAYDGTAMIKSLQMELGDAHAALSQSIDLTKSLFAEINGLKKAVAKLSNQGRGRKAVVSIHEKPTTADTMQKSDGITPREMMVKALTAQQQGKISSVEVSTLEAYACKGLTPPAGLLAKIV